ncbi:MAG: GNAT family N-acetyltransferase [Chloroflexota bacterium]
MHNLASSARTQQKAVLVIRQAEPVEFQACSQIDGRYETDYVWQMHCLEQDRFVQITFNQLRLPRTMMVDYPLLSQDLYTCFEQSTHVLIATYQEQLLGSIQANIDPINQTLTIHHLLVYPEMRQRGIGFALLKAIKAQAIKQGCRQLSAVMQTKNYPAICLAQKAGLLYCGYNDRHFHNGDIALTFSLKI